jgi:type I site-specific restriction endonuclease
MTGKTEALTRKELIDPKLMRAGWDVGNPERVGIEIPADGFDPAAWQQLEKELKETGPGWNAQTPSGFCDYVFKQENGQIVAVCPWPGPRHRKNRLVSQ